jgi:hypothetical protein
MSTRSLDSKKTNHGSDPAREQLSFAGKMTVEIAALIVFKKTSARA